LIAETCGLRSFAKDWDLNCRLSANVVATAAIGSVSRRGLGKAKHIDTIFLCVQEKVDQLKIVLKKQDTKDMLALRVLIETRDRQVHLRDGVCVSRG
jgi:hypothetical protein